MKDGTWLTQKYIAHRGLFNNVDIPENSLPAFQKAVENDFAIEMDVQMTADGRLVVFHDDEMSRMTKLSGDIREKTYDEIKDATLLDTDCTIPTFERFLETIDGKTPLVIEIKTHKKIGGVEQKILDAMKNYKGEYCFESFHPFIVRWMKVHAPDVVRGQLSCSYEGAAMPKCQRRWLKNLRFCRWNGSQFIAYDAADIQNNKYVRKYGEKMPIICWTIKSQKQHDELRQYYDNMIFDSFLPERDDIK